MVRYYKRKTDRQKWLTKSMHLAIKEVLQGKMGYKKAACKFLVPRTTLFRKVQLFRNKSAVEAVDENDVKGSMGSKRTIFSKEQEEELAQYLKDMESSLFGLTAQDLRKLAFQLAEKNKIKHNFSPEKEEAGLEWFRGFMKRHPKLSIRKPESTSIARAMGFNSVAVQKFYGLLENVLKKHSITPDRIYNCDETGISIVPKTRSRIISLKGKKRVGALTSAERGLTISVELCFNAVGSYMPPMFVFPRIRMKPELMIGAPNGAFAACHKSGWMQKDIFLAWFKKFIKFSQPSTESPVLLLLDGHLTHTKNLVLLDYAKENGVVLLCFPPHCTHRLQPLDVSFMKPLSAYYDTEVRKWLLNHPGKPVTSYQVADVFGKAFAKAASILNCTNGFKATGIWPFKPDIFSESDFSASATTDISNLSETHFRDLEKPGKAKEVQIEKNSSEGSPASYDQASSFSVLSPVQLLPIPRCKSSNRRSDARCGKTAVLTDPMYVNELKMRQAKKKVTSNENIVSKKKIRKEKKLANETSSSEEEDEDEEDAECLYCGDFYKKSIEGWVQCIKCKKWAHCSCAGEEEEDDEVSHVCELCK